MRQNPLYWIITTALAALCHTRKTTYSVFSLSRSLVCSVFSSILYIISIIQFECENCNGCYQKNNYLCHLFIWSQQPTSSGERKRNRERRLSKSLAKMFYMRFAIAKRYKCQYLFHLLLHVGPFFIMFSAATAIFLSLYLSLLFLPILLCYMNVRELITFVGRTIFFRKSTIETIVNRNFRFSYEFDDALDQRRRDKLKSIFIIV